MASLCLESLSQATPSANVDRDRGYVFLVHSDITLIACDCWIAATSGILDCFRRPVGYSMLKEPMSSYGYRVRVEYNGTKSWVYEMENWPPTALKHVTNLIRPYFINLNRTLGERSDTILNQILGERSKLKANRLAKQTCCVYKINSSIYRNSVFIYAFNWILPFCCS